MARVKLQNNSKWVRLKPITREEFEKSGEKSVVVKGKFGFYLAYRHIGDGILYAPYKSWRLYFSLNDELYKIVGAK